MKRKYYKKIDVLRVIACISVLLYHVGLLKGGYLAVCTFFVLSGFLACTSAFKRGHFSILKYYQSRLRKIYFPLLIVVFLSVFAIRFVPGTNWFNLKTETTSVILGYNNYWQIGANLDYFARSANSPFVHFWYVSILMQFDLIFPFLYLGLRRIGEKVNKVIPGIITGLLSLVSFIFFYKLNTSGNFNSSYYDSFARFFSLLIGVTAGFTYSYFKDLFKARDKSVYLINRMFYSFLLVLVLLFFAIDSSFYYFPLIMLLVSLISVYLIIYAMEDFEPDNSLKMKFVKSLSSVSYEVYLVQYPIIYIFKFLGFNKYVSTFLIVAIVFILSYILHNAFYTRWNESENMKKIKKIIRDIILFIALSGFIMFVFSTNNSKEMKALEEELSRKEETIEEVKENFDKEREEELNKHLATIEDYDKRLENIDNTILELPVVGVGDSIMLGAVDNLHKQFKNGYFDAEVSRSVLRATGILNDLNSKGMLKGPIVINLGANGDCSKSCKLKIVEAARGNEILWVTVTNDKSVHINDDLKELAEEVSNFHVIDWETISAGHKEYFYADGIHLTGSGRKAYTAALYDAIKGVYVDKIMSEKENLEKEFNDTNKAKITFFGNDLLLYSFDKLKGSFNSSIFNIDRDYKFNSLKNKLNSLIEDDALTNRVVLVLDGNSSMFASDFATIANLCKDREVYAVSMDSKLTEELKNIKNINVIDFSKTLSDNKDYVLKDGIHLTEKGNNALAEMLERTLLES